MTNEQGVAQISIDASTSDYEVNIWSPRFRDGKELLVKRISASESMNAEFKLQKSLRPPSDDHSESLEWSDY